MNLRTVQDRVIIAVEFKGDTATSGIFLGEGEMKYDGVVLAAGPKVNSVKVGDRVMFFDGKGARSNIAGKKVLVLREDDLMGVLEV
jgi:co-chaperonin GroES (HSP10)